MSDDGFIKLTLDGEPLFESPEMFYGIGTDANGDAWVYAAFKADAAIDLFGMMGNMIPGYEATSKQVAELMGLTDNGTE